MAICSQKQNESVVTFLFWLFHSLIDHNSLLKELRYELPDIIYSIFRGPSVRARARTHTHTHTHTHTPYELSYWLQSSVEFMVSLSIPWFLARQMSKIIKHGYPTPCISWPLTRSITGCLQHSSGLIHGSQFSIVHDWIKASSHYTKKEVKFPPFLEDAAPLTLSFLYKPT